MTTAAPVSVDADAPPPLKPGYATTEFWTTLIFSLLALLTGLNVLGPDWAHLHEGVVNALAILASVLAPGLYALGRSLAKGQHANAVASVLNTRMALTSTDAGYALLALIGIIIAAIGAIWLILGAVHHVFDVIGLILLVIGAVIVWFDGSNGRRVL